MHQKSLPLNKFQRKVLQKDLYLKWIDGLHCPLWSNLLKISFKRLQLQVEHKRWDCNKSSNISQGNDRPEVISSPPWACRVPAQLPRQLWGRPKSETGRTVLSHPMWECHCGNVWVPKNFKKKRKEGGGDNLSLWLTLKLLFWMSMAEQIASYAYLC